MHMEGYKDRLFSSNKEGLLCVLWMPNRIEFGHIAKVRKE